MISKLPRSIQKSLIALLADIEDKGPVRGTWTNYGKFSPSRHHCHIKKGKPIYVVFERKLTHLLRCCKNLPNYIIGPHVPKYTPPSFIKIW